MIVKITGKLVALYNERAIIEYLPFEYETLIPEFTRRQLQINAARVIRMAKKLTERKTGGKA